MLPAAEEARRNHFLGRMPEMDLAAILPRLEAMSLPCGMLLAEQRCPAEYLYFPTTAVISILQVMENGASVEAATIGREGMVGISAVIGSGESLGRAVVQVRGDSLRLAVRSMRRLSLSDRFHELLRRVAAAFFLQVMQSLGCHQLHSARQRTCRWLLQMQDRAEADTFYMTQEFLAELLGLRRATVSEIAFNLQKRGMLSYSRGRVTVLDRVAMEHESCECYKTVRADFDRLLGRRNL